MNSASPTTGLYDGAATYYARFRPGIPAAAIDYLRERFALSQDAAVLDLGCGTGQLACAIGPSVGSVLGVDVDADMIAMAENTVAADERLQATCRFEVGKAEALEVHGRTFDLITACRSFHWMDQGAVLTQGHHLLRAGGGFALLGDNSFWSGTESWQITTKGVVQEFLGEKRRAGSGYFATSPEPYTSMLVRHGYSDVEAKEFGVRREWRFDQVLGCLYSTSFAARRLFGERVAVFERRLWEALGEPNEKARFVEEAHFTVQSGRHPAP